MSKKILFFGGLGLSLSSDVAKEGLSASSSGERAAYSSSRSPLASTAKDIREDLLQDLKGELYLYEQLKERTEDERKAHRYCLKKDLDKFIYADGLAEPYHTVAVRSIWWTQAINRFEKVNTFLGDGDSIEKSIREMDIATLMSPTETTAFEKNCRNRVDSHDRRGMPVYFYHSSTNGKFIYEEMKSGRGGLKDGAFLTSHFSVAFARANKGPGAGIFRVLACLNKDNILPIDSLMKLSYKKSGEPAVPAIDGVMSTPSIVAKKDGSVSLGAGKVSKTKATGKLYVATKVVGMSKGCMYSDIRVLPYFESKFTGVYGGRAAFTGGATFKKDAIIENGIRFKHTFAGNSSVLSEWTAIRGISQDIRVQAFISWNSVIEKVNRDSVKMASAKASSITKDPEMITASDSAKVPRLRKERSHSVAAERFPSRCSSKEGYYGAPTKSLDPAESDVDSQHVRGHSTLLCGATMTETLLKGLLGLIVLAFV